MKRIVGSGALLFMLVLLYLSAETTGDPRTHMINLTCTQQPEHNSTVYVPNFVATMENISAQIRSSHFGVSLVGKPPDASYGLAQCYGDLPSLDCVLCYAEARTLLPQCFPNNGGRIYLDGCFMRAENYSFFEETTGPLDTAVCGNATLKSARFEASVRRAISDATAAAPVNDGYARARALVSGSTNDSAYVLADCWKTLSFNSCIGCLKNASTSVSKCLPQTEGRALNTGCYLQYSNKDFMNPEPSGDSKVSTVVIIVATVSSVAVVFSGAVIACYIWKQKRIKKKRKGSNDAEQMASTLNDSSLNFKYSTLEKATGSFDVANKLGQGGFGSVYKGVLADGREIAVKRLFLNNKHRAADFYNEVNIISSVEHKNLVRLLGCSCSGPESLLVYEFLPNKSLDCFIFDAERGKALSWDKRFEIIIGTVEGLAYLHENSKVRIIHRDIKASNILLDSRLRAKIADFGLARSFQEDKSHISTAIAGTLGYMAPEYLAHGQLTEKADVYSFGVLLIETVTARQNNKTKEYDYTDSLVTATWRHFQAKQMEDLIDPNLLLHNNQNSETIKEEILRVVHVALLCTQENHSLRPPMSRVLRMLQRKEKELPPPTNPPFVDERTMELNDTSDAPQRPLFTSTSYSVGSVSYSFYPR
ncbi:cysteine-rich receptor-like protein kinase 2 [Aristolochia californica]|uniref:cysteine-rich receptor-like protein kinase 2 n=1 Tax=Aristolochia californica TaxID=171875 RepID=UPI0035D9559E